jgi:hypothetical protein
MFVYFWGVVTNCFGAYCIEAWLDNLGRYSSQGLFNLSLGLGNLSQGRCYLSLGLGYLIKGLWRLAYAYIYRGVFVCADFMTCML